MERTYIITVNCEDRAGLTADITHFIQQHNGFIKEVSQHSDPVEHTFFMRLELIASSIQLPFSKFEQQFSSFAQSHHLNFCIKDSDIKPKVLLCVSQYEHCLADILYRWRTQDFEFDIAGVVSNHQKLQDYVEWHNIPFHYLPVTKVNHAETHQKIEDLFQQSQSDVMVLARYMQIIPASMCSNLQGKIINIHHSFLPSFIGAKPYHQAFDRGVKLIGATCHFVTEHLDQGPIIDQDVVRINHTHNVDDMVRLGKDIEKKTLANGLRNFCQQRVLLHNQKTIIFE
ncbi:MAG: formyltetrahydrofolate deformylase [Gammaproteobacteria bacterium]|nr:formyltetrahydrofolate deformylase [Gammaproteobacteria bacterium]